jgi:2-methylaconitate cis-trans-isomerase PrpF
VFVASEDLGLAGVELPAVLAADAGFLSRMEAIRQAGSVAMGLAPDLAAAATLASMPQVAMVCGPKTSPMLSGETLRAREMDLAVRMISVGQPHRAVPITGAVCLAVAARVPGTIPQRLCASDKGPIRVGHPSGTILVDATVTRGRAVNGAVYRSARRLFEGNVVCRAP